jgi:hypothetical protein
LQIRGPLTATGMSKSASRSKIFICSRPGPRDEAACANKIVEDLARRAFRRPVTAEDVNPLMAFYKADTRRRLRGRCARCAHRDSWRARISCIALSRESGTERDAHADRSGTRVASVVLPVEQSARTRSW